MPDEGGEKRMLKMTARFIYRRNLLREKVLAWLKEENGATVAEYALVLALVVVVLIGALGGLGQALKDKIEQLKTMIEGAG